MSQPPTGKASESASMALDQMIFAPLAGRIGSIAGSPFYIAEWKAAGSPPGPPNLIAPLHIHHSDDEAWYVLEGTLAFRLGDEDVEAGAGSLVIAPHGVPHTYWNPRSELARYLLIMPPIIHHLIAALHAAPDRSPQSIEAIYQQHNSALRH